MTVSNRCSCCNTVAKHTVTSMTGELCGYLCNMHNMMFNKLAKQIECIIITAIPEEEIYILA